MGRTITLDVPEPLFEWVANAAGERGMTPSDWIVDQIVERSEQSRIGRDTSATDGLGQNGSVEAEERLIAMFGSFNSGDPHSCNNEKIDADLAREYGRGLAFED